MRLKRKAKNLSTDELVEVLTMRVAAQKAKAESHSGERIRDVVCTDVGAKLSCD